MPDGSAAVAQVVVWSQHAAAALGAWMGYCLAVSAWGAWRELARGRPDERTDRLFP